MTTTPLEDIDLLEDTWAREIPYGALDRLRREDPVHWHPEADGRGFWAVTKHADVKAVSHDPKTFSSERGGTFIDDQTDATVYWNYLDLRFRALVRTRIGARLTESTLIVRLDAIP